MKKYTFIFLVVFSMAFSFGISLAHAQSGKAIPIGFGPGNRQNTPIGGIAIFAAVGGGYAIKKLYDQRKV